MIPIVFCASLVPCERENAAAEPSCARRNQRSTDPYGDLWKSHDIATISAHPTAMPMSGESTMKESVLTHAMPGTIARMPTRATAAPAYPPISACEEEDGMPKYQVIRFQAIAPRRPPSTTSELTTVMSIRPEPIVFATAVPNTNAATKLKKAAQKTAWNGDSTRVDTTVAIEFAESCIPLMKSKTSAIPMMKRT